MTEKRTMSEHLSTGRLLVGGFIVMLILMAALAIGAIREIDTLAGLTNKIYRHPLAVSNAVQEANANIIAMHRDMKDVALARNAGELETAITSVAEHEIRVYRNFEIIMERFLGEKSRIQQARKTFTDWRPIRSEVIELTREGNYAEAAKITKGKGARHVVKMSSQMDGLIDFARSKALQFLDDSKQKQALSGNFLYSMLIVVVLSGSAIAFFVVTRVRNAEGRILKAMNEAERANNAKSEFLSSMSHDLRTPLNAIIGFSDMISGETYGPLDNERYQEYTRAISSSGQHLVHLVNDILDLSKIEAGHYEIENTRLKLADVISDTLRMVDPLARAKGLKITTDIPDDLPDLWCDKRSIMQILTNLLSNAIKFTEQGGAIVARACRNDEGTISIAVSDTGIGISDEVIASVIEPFYRGDSHLAKKQEGTGLGLHLCNKLSELLDATLDIQSGPGGTTVSVIFPRERNMEPRLVG